MLFVLNVDVYLSRGVVKVLAALRNACITGNQISPFSVNGLEIRFGLLHVRLIKSIVM